MSVDKNAADSREQDPSAQSGSRDVANDPRAVERYRDMAIGMYLYWTVDAQFGMVNAHSVIGASRDYLGRYFTEMPATFYPEHFDARWYARLARQCGFDYVCITPKNHNGFCMWDTETSDFNIMNTPFARDAIAELTRAFRELGIAVSFYFSPDDAWFQWKRGAEPTRVRPDCLPSENPALLEHDAAQLRELIGRYSPDMLCFDHKPHVARPLVEIARRLDPGVMITRGVLPTPEQALSDRVSGPFEAHFTIGTQWQYKAGNDVNKTGGELVGLLADIRSRGGTLLLAIGGPDADGRLPRDKDDLVRELGLWLFVNGEAVKNVRPWSTPREGSVFYTRSNREPDTAYVIDCTGPLAKGEWRELELRGIAATSESEVSVLGSSGSTLEYEPDFNPTPSLIQRGDVLSIRYTRTQRLYNDMGWPNPCVLKVTRATTPRL